MDKLDLEIRKFEDFFEDICDKNIYPELLKFKAKQLLCIAVFLIVTAGALFIIFASVKTVLFTNGNKKLAENMMCLSAFTVFAWYFISFSINKFFKNCLKKACMQKAISIFDNLEYVDANKNREFLPDKDIVTSEIYTQKNDYNTKDYSDAFSGTFNNIKFIMCELFLKRISGKDAGNTFNGIAVKFDLNNDVKMPLKIVTEKARKKDNADYNIRLTLTIILCLFCFVISCFMGCLFFDSSFRSSFLQVASCIFVIVSLDVFVYIVAMMPKKYKYKDKVAPIVINGSNSNSQKYLIYSNYGSGALKYTTCELINIMENFQKVFKCKDVKCSVFYNKILFAIRTNKDFFEFGGLFSNLKDKKRMKNFFEIFSLIYSVTDYLNKTDFSKNDI